MGEGNTRPTVSPWSAIRAFRQALREAYGEGFRGLVLFGSLARGEWTPDSDIDLVVLLEEGLDPRAEQERVWKMAWALDPDRTLSLQPLVMTEEQARRGSSPLLFNIRREGWWIMPIENPGEVQELLRKARRYLDDARDLLARGSYDSSASRAYYAMFNAAQAALLSRGITRSRHQGVTSAFGYYFVREGLFPHCLFSALEEGYEKRLVADYSPFSLSKEEARSLCRRAEEFLEGIQTLVAKEEG